MAERKHPWEEYVRAGVTAKAANPKLTASEFYRTIGFKTEAQRKQADKAIGAKLVAEWRKLAEGAMNLVQRAAQRKLAEDIQDVIDVGRQQLKMGARGLREALDPDGKTIPAMLDPKKPDDYLTLITSGAKLITMGTAVLTGNKPLAEAAPEEDIDIEFHPSEEGEKAGKVRAK